MFKNEKCIKHLVAGFTALVAFITYAMTMAPTVSFWDCGEFIACANTLGIPHPPGTPFFVFFARAVIVLLPFVEEIAKRVNYISVVSSAATVYVISLFAWDLLSKVLSKETLASKLSTSTRYIVLGTAGLVSGFLLTFSDTFWFNAVEAEVYGVAMFILVLVSYLGLMWYDRREREQGDRILIFICYIAFLGVGAHLYTMLTIPALFVLILIADFNKIKEKTPIWITGILLCSVIYYVSGFISISLVTLFALLVLTLTKPFSAQVMRYVRLALAFTFVALIGYSTHLYIPIRSELNPIIDENNPEINIRDDQGQLQLGNLLKDENWVAFNNFIERKQYGSESMISRAFYRRAQLSHQILSFPNMGFGGYQLAQYLPFKVGGVNSSRGLYSFDASENQPQKRLGIEFPTQMTVMGDKTFVQLLWFLFFNGIVVAVCVYTYRRHKKMGVYLSVLYALCSLGLIFYINFADGTRMEKRDYDYWMNAMSRNITDLNRSGVAISSVPDANALIDMRQNIESAKQRVSNLRYNNADPSAIASAEADVRKYENSAIWQNWKQIENAYARVGQRPPFPEPVHLEVRERDYFYTPAFIFMSLVFGIGAGILVLLVALYQISFTIPAAAVLTLVAFLVPSFSNYKEHDRSGLWVPWDYAYNLLQSCRPNAILFTNGDNDTFPLWFAQEVAGIRKDVRVVNLSLGNTDWYIKQILENEPVLKLSYDKQGIDRDMVISDASDNNPNHMTATWVKKANTLIPILEKRIQEMESPDSTQAIVPLDSAKLMQFKVMLQVYTAFKEWQERSGAGLMLTQHKLVIDLAINNMDRPIHFSTTVGSSNFMGLEKYMVQEGLIYNFIKGDLTSRQNDFDMERSGKLIDSVYKFRCLGDGSCYINTETERLLSSYTSLYLQIAFNLREQIVAIRKAGPYTIEKKALVDEKLKQASHYLEKGIYQFPHEWRSYWAAGFVYEAAGQNKKAVEFLEKGLKNVPEYEVQGRARLSMSAQSLQGVPDATPVMKIESQDSAQDTSISDSSTTKNQE